MNEYKVVSHVTGGILAVRVIETEMSYYAQRIEKDPDTLPHRKSLETRMNTEYNKYPTSGLLTQMAALELFGLVWIGANKGKA